MCEKKSDASQIIEFIDKLKNDPSIKYSDRSFWPDFLFHYTPLETAIKILNDGKLKSRYDLERNDELLIDIACKDILSHTDTEKKKNVRLYFRPKTPTQYKIEGIRTDQAISEYDAHCPIPIFFLFDSKELLTLKHTKFTDGNISSTNVIVDSSASFLKQLPFNKIYHIGPYNPNLHWEIKFHRCAEILYPHELNLSTLKYICCRSDAEKDTLLNLLPLKIWSEWKNKIIVSRTSFFEGKWTFLDKVQLFDNKILFYFSPDTKTPGPFVLKLQIMDIETGKTYKKTINDFYTTSYKSSCFNIALPETVESYNVKLYLDDNLCYSNDYNKYDLPF